MYHARPVSACTLHTGFERRRGFPRKNFAARISIKRAATAMEGEYVQSTPVKSKSDRRIYRFFRLSNGVRAVVAQDPDAVFGAVAVNVQAGYFDDPPDIMGLAHYLEHAVHLGSQKYPEETAYKYYLSEHGGASNALTSMVHTQFHCNCQHEYLQGAMDRLAQFFIAPLLVEDAVERELQAVHAEFSRNTNSDARKVVQLRRDAGVRPYSMFSTGNLETLHHRPRGENRNVREALAAFWDELYVGSNMTVAVVGPQPVQVLQSWVELSFASVRSHATSPSTNSSIPRSVWQGQEFSAWDPAQLGMMYEVTPQRQKRQLDMVWLISRGMHHDDRCKPWCWVSFLLGHEAEGSVAHLLKKQGMIQELSTHIGDNVRLGRGFVFFHVTLELTQVGLMHVPTIMQAVYTGLGVLRGTSDEERKSSYSEVSQVARVQWDHKDTEEPVTLACTLAKNLHYHAAEDVLSEPSLLYGYDEESINRFLSELVPHNMNVFFSSSEFKDPPTHKEQWYGAEYTPKRLPAELMRALAEAGNASPNSAHVHPHHAPPLNKSDAQGSLGVIRLPERNWAIPSTLALEPAKDEDCGTIRFLLDRPGVRLWHCQDASFQMPKAQVLVHIISNEVFKDPLSLMTARVFIDLLEDDLEATMYHAQLLSSGYNLSYITTGLTLVVYGYSATLPRLLDLVVARMTSFSAQNASERISVIRGALSQSMENWAKNSPASHAVYGIRHLLQLPHWHVRDTMAALAEVTPELIGGFMSKVMENGAALEMLCYGNLDDAQARCLSDRVVQVLQPRGVPQSLAFPVCVMLGSGHPREAVAPSNKALSCSNSPLDSDASEAVENDHNPKGLVVYVLTNPNPSNNNHAAAILLQVGHNTPELYALVSLFAQIASKPCFNQLRTVEQLGYMVSSGVFEVENVIGFVIRVQSPKYDPGHIQDRMYAWLASFRSHLEDMSEEQLTNFVDALCAKFLQPPKRLDQAVGRVWSEIEKRTYCFNRRKLMAASLEEMTIDRLLQLYDNHLSDTAMTKRHLTVQLWGGKDGMERAASSLAAIDGAKVDVIHDNAIEQFQFKMPVFDRRVEHNPGVTRSKI